MKTIKVNYGGFETDQQVDESIYNAIYDKAIDDFETKIIGNCESMRKDGESVIVIRTDIFKFILKRLKAHCNKFTTKDIIEGTAENCCGKCFWYNGIMGDGYQFCDTREIDVRDTDYCCRYKFLDKSEMTAQLKGGNNE